MERTKTLLAILFVAAAFGEEDEARLLVDAGTVLRDQHGSFACWLDLHHPRSPEEWQNLFKKTFVFTRGEIARSFLLSTGYLPGAHDDDCPTFQKIAAFRPVCLEVPQ